MLRLSYSVISCVIEIFYPRDRPQTLYGDNAIARSCIPGPLGLARHFLLRYANVRPHNYSARFIRFHHPLPAMPPVEPPLDTPSRNGR
jgi:hypothetical protein